MYLIPGVLGLLGVLLVAAPFALGYNTDTYALWSSIVLGVVVILVAVYKAVVRDTARWEYWAAGIVGVLAIVAPFVLGFNTLTSALWTFIVLGAILVLLDGYLALMRQQNT
jgi:bacteriorhodopsin